MWFLAFAVVVVLFSFVLLFGAPYLPTQKSQAAIALDLLDLKKGQLFFELGCGDGRVLRLAAQRGLRAVGYELNPLLVLVALAVTWRYRRQVTIVWGSFWRADLAAADGVFVFLLDRFMPRLDALLAAQRRPLALASYTFKIPGRKAVRRRGGVFLYKY